MRRLTALVGSVLPQVLSTSVCLCKSQPIAFKSIRAMITLRCRDGNDQHHNEPGVMLLQCDCDLKCDEGAYTALSLRERRWMKASKSAAPSMILTYLSTFLAVVNSLALRSFTHAASPCVFDRTSALWGRHFSGGSTLGAASSHH